MRLIDAEKVVHEYYKNPSYQQLCKVLNEAPTVKAIPIEWIEEWYKTHVYYLKEEKPIIYAYEQMIMDWEKEHEENN